MVRRATLNWRESAEMFGRSVGFLDQFANAILARQPVAGAAEQIQRVHTMRAFERLELPHEFFFAAFREGGFHGALEFVDVHRLRQAIMRAARALERANLLVHFQRAGNNDDGHEGQELFELWQKIEAEFAIREDMIQNEQLRSFARDLRERLGAVFDTR